MRILQESVKALLALWLAIAPVYAGSMTLLGVGGGTAAPYVGPGDVSVNGSTNNWYAWYSCARVYKASLASTSTNLCDLVDSASPTVVICTLRGTASGLVDLAGAYCTGGLTPSAKCAAATGGVCNISQVYDQTGNARPVLQATAANQPFLTFNALNGLPAIQCTAATCYMQTASSSFVINQPLTESGVFIEPTPGASTATIIGQPSVASTIGGSGSANLAAINAGAQVTATATSNVWHAINGLLNNTTCALNIDGTDSAPLNCGAQFFNTQPIRIMRGNATQLIGSIAETGLLAVTSSATDRGNIRLNQKAYYNTP